MVPARVGPARRLRLAPGVAPSPAVAGRKMGWQQRLRAPPPIQTMLEVAHRPIWERLSPKCCLPSFPLRPEAQVPLPGGGRWRDMQPDIAVDVAGNQAAAPARLHRIAAVIPRLPARWQQASLPQR